MLVNQQAVKAIELAIKLVQSYPAYPTTFSTCSDCQSKQAKGGMQCTDCLEDELAELVGYQLAREFHHQIKGQNGQN
ncbi:hypothetical protein [Methylobacter marinus]|uniref:hypothetical protein n=1 Tax=Methylobacter marinus TaxID=34058 RepID=UPI00037D0428|nr:hypothetical protein [Methylobacter marinus]